MLPALVAVAAAGIYLKFRSKKVHGQTGRSHFKMAALGLNAAVTCLLLRQKSWKRERRSKCGLCCVAVKGAVTSQTLLLLRRSASFQSRPESTKDGVMLLGVKSSAGDENGELVPSERCFVPGKRLIVLPRASGSARFLSALPNINTHYFGRGHCAAAKCQSAPVRGRCPRRSGPSHLPLLVQGSDSHLRNPAEDLLTSFSLKCSKS